MVEFNVERWAIKKDTFHGEQSRRTTVAYEENYAHNDIPCMTLIDCS